jgi:hypothetical protein
MIYLRCPFCDKVSGEIEGNAILKEPIANYYSEIDVVGNINVGGSFIVNGLVYFPHAECYLKHIDVEKRKRDAGTFSDPSVYYLACTGDI